MIKFFKNNNNQFCSKRLLAMLFGLSAMVLSFIYIYSDGIAEEKRRYVSDIIITFAIASSGTHMFTTGKWNEK